MAAARVLAGSLTLGALVAFIQYSERFWRPISDLSEKFNILQAAMAASERIFTLLDTPARVVAPARPRAWRRCAAAWPSRACGSPTRSHRKTPFAGAARERIHFAGARGGQGVRRSTPC